jgi:hypothetical protein
MTRHAILAILALALQSPAMPQTIPGLLAELQSLVLPNLTSENPENTTRYTASQTLDVDECLVTITRTLKLSGEVNENIMRQTTFDFGDNYVVLTDWRNERGFSDILFRPLTYKEPFPSIIFVDLAAPGGAIGKAGAITIEFDDQRKMVRAVELIHFLQQMCAKN